MQLADIFDSKSKFMRVRDPCQAPANISLWETLVVVSFIEKKKKLSNMREGCWLLNEAHNLIHVGSIPTPETSVVSRSDCLGR